MTDEPSDPELRDGGEVSYSIANFIFLAKELRKLGALQVKDGEKVVVFSDSNAGLELKAPNPSNPKKQSEEELFWSADGK